MSNLETIRKYENGFTIKAAEDLLIISHDDSSVSWSNYVGYYNEITTLIADIIEATGIKINDLIMELER